MGKHYVPQEYLRGFLADEISEELWMYDRREKAWSYAAISKVAQQPDYYAPDVEEALARDVELPGHVALGRLRSFGGMDGTGRQALAVYTGVMCMRVPRKRRKGHEMAPGVFTTILAETREELGKLAAAEPDPRIPRVLAELDRLEAKYKDDPSVMIPDQIKSPWASTDIIDCIARMVWRFMVAPAGEHFVTTDNPAYFFESYGLGTPLAELTFPLSSKIMLFGSHQGVAGSTVLIEPNRGLLKEANRRVISGAERFVFTPRRGRWIETVASRTDPYLSRIAW